MKINYPALPILGVGFTRATSIPARIIQITRKILRDHNAPNHSFLITGDHGQLFATEETSKGLQERSLEQYTKKSNHIVAVLLWKGFTVETKEAAQKYLAEIRRKNGEESRYDFRGLLWFLNKKFKTDPKRQWCSENCASILKKYGASWIKETRLAPDQLINIMIQSGECEAITDYYIN
jgi:hypothetical protein